MLPGIGVQNGDRLLVVASFQIGVAEVHHHHLVVRHPGTEAFQPGDGLGAAPLGEIDVGQGVHHEEILRVAAGQLLHQGVGLVGALELQQGQRLAIDGGVLEGVIPLLQAAVEVGEQPLGGLGAVAHLDAHLGQPEVQTRRQGTAAIAAGTGAGLADPGLGQGVGQQHLRRLAGVAVLRRQLLEEVGHAHGIEPGVIQRLHADAIRFVFVVPGVVDG